jgi:hypothetical protein
MDTQAYINERITATKSLIEAYETAQLSIISGAIESYTIDTGQNRTTVNKLNVSMLSNQIDALYARLAMLQARLNGGSVTVVPIW